MAYLRDLVRKCDNCHHNAAKFELMTHWNELYGYYCTPCSGHVLRQVEADEQARFARERNQRD